MSLNPGSQGGYLGPARGIVGQATTEGVTNASGTTLETGEVVRISADNAVTRSQADAAPNYAGTVGAVSSGGPNGQIVTVVNNGKGYVKLEPGLAPSPGDNVWVSATVAGSATNVSPPNELILGVIKDTSMYDGVTNLLVYADLSINSGGSSGIFPGFGGVPPAIAAAGSAGAAASASRSDHTHEGVHSLIAGSGINVSSATGDVTVSVPAALQFPGYGGAPPAIAAAGASGGAATVSRSDHTHEGVHSNVAGTGITVSAPTGDVTINVVYGGVPPAIAAAGSAGVAASASRSDHTHEGVHSNVAGTGITVSGATGDVTINVVYGGVPPAIAAAGSAGVAASASRSDHTHEGVHSNVAGNGISVSSATGDVTITTLYGGAPAAIASAGSAGTNNTASRSNHTHEGVHSIIAGTGIAVSGATGDVTVSARGIDTFVWTIDNYGPTSTAFNIYAPLGYTTNTTVVYTVAAGFEPTFRVSHAGTLHNMRVRHNRNNGFANAITYTVRVNGADTALAVTLNSSAADGTNLATSIAVAAGDRISLRIQSTGVGTTTQMIAAISVEFD